MVTTRLSSVTMKTATDVIASVHSALGVRPCPTAAGDLGARVGHSAHGVTLKLNIIPLS